MEENHEYRDPRQAALYQESSELGYGPLYGCLPHRSKCGIVFLYMEGIVHCGFCVVVVRKPGNWNGLSPGAHASWLHDSIMGGIRSHSMRASGARGRADFSGSDA